MATTATPTPQERERERVRTIVALCRKHRLPESTENHLIEHNFTIEESRAYVLNQITGKQEPVARSSSDFLSVGLSEKEQKQYSLCRAISEIATNSKDNSFEREVSDTLSKQIKRSTVGLFVPLMDLRLEARNYATSSPSTGGATVATITDGSSLIEVLRNRMLCLQMGATQMMDLRGNIDIPRQSSTSNLYWISEGQNLGQSESTFDTVQLRPKTAGNISKYTRNMLMQSSIDIEAFVRNDLTLTIATGLDRAILNGSGVSNEPLGILNNPAVPVVSLGTNGGNISWASILRLETLVSKANADIGSLGYMVSPDLRGVLKGTTKVVNAATADFIWEQDPITPHMGKINSYIAGATNQIPSNLTKGTGTNLSAAIFGNWADVILGQWGAFELLSNPYSAGDFEAGNVEVRCLQTVDVAIRRPTSFSVIKDAITS